MEDEVAALLEQNALSELHRISAALKKTCVCSSKVSKCRTICGWGPTLSCNSPVRLKGKKAGTESNKQMSRFRNRNVRTAKPDTGEHDYFRNFSSRKQHMENYSAKFSSTGQHSTQNGRTGPQTAEIDPYLLNKGDHRSLFNRLKLLQTLSDFYSMGVSSRDLRRQAHLPPVHLSYRHAKRSNINLSARIDAEEVINVVAKEMEKCKIRDDAYDGDVDKESTGYSSASLPSGSSLEWLSSQAASSVTRDINGDTHEQATVYKNFLRDLRSPSQKIIDGLHGRLKEELTVLRSGSENYRKQPPFNLHTDRFAEMKQKQPRTDNRLAVKEKTVNSIPNMKNRKTLYISILGRNPLTRESLDNT